MSTNCYITVYITVEAATGCVLDFCVLTRAIKKKHVNLQP